MPVTRRRSAGRAASSGRSRSPVSRASRAASPDKRPTGRSPARQGRTPTGRSPSPSKTRGRGRSTSRTKSPSKTNPKTKGEDDDGAADTANNANFAFTVLGTTLIELPEGAAEAELPYGLSIVPAIWKHDSASAPVKATTMVVATLLLFATPMLPSLIDGGDDAGWDAVHGLGGVSLALPTPNAAMKLFEQALAVPPSSTLALAQVRLAR